MSYNSKDFFNQINKFDYRIVFLTIYIVGLVILYFASKAHPLIMIGLSIVLMLLYAIYAYSYVESKNLSQIADSAYFLGFLFTLSSITMALLNYVSGGDPEKQMGNIVNMFGFALLTTIMGLLIKLLLERIKQ